MSAAGAGFWVYHAPPAGVPVSCSGLRSYGDAELSGWIAQYQPDLVFGVEGAEPEQMLAFPAWVPGA